MAAARRAGETLTEPQPRVGSVLAGAAMLIVGSSVAVSESITRYPVLSGQAMRYGFAALVLGAWVAVRREHVRPTLPELARLLALGATGLAAFNVFLVLALRHAEPAAVGVIVGAVPIVLAALGPLLAGSRPAPRVVNAALVVTAGAAVVQRGGDHVGVASVVSAMSENAASLAAEPILPRLGAALSRTCQRGGSHVCGVRR